MKNILKVVYSYLLGVICIGMFLGFIILMHKAMTWAGANWTNFLITCSALGFLLIDPILEDLKFSKKIKKSVDKKTKQ